VEAAVKACIEWTTAQERDLIVDGALELLETLGMHFGPGDAFEALGEAGARVDRDTGVARLPRELVEHAIAQCPREIVLGGAAPDDDCVLTDGVPHFVNSGSPTSILDFRTGKRRASTSQDLREATTVLDAMPSVSIVWGLASATDLAPERATLESLAIELRHTTKHVQHDVDGRWQVDACKRMVEIAGGDLWTRPRVSLICCTASPLHAHAELLDASTDLAALGFPVVIMPMPISGGTAPLTVAGTVTMVMAEFLGAATAMQLRAPGSRLILGAVPGLLDMKQTTFSFAAPESALAAAVSVEVGHSLGVPVLAPSHSTDAKHAGIQAAYEKSLKGLAVASTRPDLMTGIGMLHAANLPSLPQIVIDDETARMMLRLLDGSDITDETIMVEMMERVGFSGSYLLEKDTRQRLRAGEVFTPAVSNRQSYEHWRVAGKDELALATDKVLEILAAAQERGPLLGDDQVTELESCIAAAAAAAPA
jgi:trimethylamine---corrinoid protein Co-methyltransferase